jgi:hypothetical protein
MDCRLEITVHMGTARRARKAQAHHTRKTTGLQVTFLSFMGDFRDSDCKTSQVEMEALVDGAIGWVARVVSAGRRSFLWRLSANSSGFKVS